VPFEHLEQAGRYNCLKPLRNSRDSLRRLEGPSRRIDALLNIAGAVPQIDLFQMTDAQWDDGMALKLNGARRLTIEAWDALKASKGSVVFMSGSAAFAPKPG
jgi:NAD(P)-dependent dehydrogenase (short-subunit alcohol dehydrogenase family)